MNKNTTPRPKSKREFLDTLVNPYNGSNPNVIPSEPFIPGTPEFNRAREISLKNDKAHDVSIGLEDNDGVIPYYFNNVIKPSIVQNGNKINVPLIYGSPERWKAVQADGYYRDKNGKIMSPLIMFKRNTIVPNRNLGNKVLENNKVHISFSYESPYTRQNQYDQFSVLTGRKPVKEGRLVVIPDYVTITYSFTIFTNYVEQNNKLIEAINYASPSFWGDPDKFQFRALISNFNNTNEYGDSEDRVIKSDFELTLNGYLIPDSINKDLSTAKKYYTNAQLAIKTTFNEIQPKTESRIIPNSKS